MRPRQRIELVPALTCAVLFVACAAAHRDDMADEDEPATVQDDASTAGHDAGPDQSADGSSADSVSRDAGSDASGSAARITCEYIGTVHLLGDQFPHIDGCNTCSCSAEGIACTQASCPRTATCTFNGQVFADGAQTRCSGDCNTCYCNKGQWEWTLIACH